MRLDDAVRAACLAKLEAEARTDYLASLLLPPALRDAHLALRAFHAELVAVPFRVREAIAGQIRLQWWRDVVERERDVEARANPASAAILAFLDAEPDAAAPLAAKVEAHERDLYGDASADWNELEGYAGETRSVLYQLLARMAGEAEAATEASGHAGVAEYMSEVLVNWPAMRGHGRVFVPETVLVEAGTDANGWLAGAPAEVEDRVVTAWGEACRRHCEAARAAVPAGLRKGPYRPLAVFSANATRAVRTPGSVRTGGVAMSPLRRQWLLWRGP